MYGELDSKQLKPFGIHFYVHTEIYNVLSTFGLACVKNKVCTLYLPCVWTFTL